LKTVQQTITEGINELTVGNKDEQNNQPTKSGEKSDQQTKPAEKSDQQAKSGDKSDQKTKPAEKSNQQAKTSEQQKNTQAKPNESTASKKPGSILGAGAKQQGAKQISIRGIPLVILIDRLV
jgi:hypothetical protein